MNEVIEQAITPESQNEGQTAEPVQKDEFEDKFLRLTRKERALQQAQAELKAKQAEIEKMKSEYDSFMSRKSKVKEDPFEAFNLLGVSYEELTKAMLEKTEPPPDKLTEIERKLQMLEEREEKQKQQAKLEQERALEEQRQKTIEAFQGDLAKFIESSDYELVKANDGQELVFEIIQQDFQRQISEGSKEPKIMEYQAACEKAETWFESQLDKLLTLNKVKSRLQPKEDQPKSPFEATVSQPRMSVPSTLTNSMKASSEPTTPQSRRPTEQELFARAASMIKFNN